MSIDARAVSECCIAPLGRRWLHAQAVAARAEAIAGSLLNQDDQRRAVDAAWLHDIGYAPDLVASGLHPLDGARYLRQRGDVDAQVVLLVAHHTGALVEAEERGLLDELREFEPPDAYLLDVLTTADVVTGPDGSWLRAEDRVSEILSRYEPGTPVHRAVSRSAPDLIAAVERVEYRLAEAGAPAAQPM